MHSRCFRFIADIPESVDQPQMICAKFHVDNGSLLVRETQFSAFQYMKPMPSPVPAAVRQHGT